MMQRIGPIDRTWPTAPRGRGQRQADSPIDGLPLAGAFRRRDADRCRAPVYALAAFLAQMIGARLRRNRVVQAREYCASVHDAYRRAAGSAPTIGLWLTRTV